MEIRLPLREEDIKNLRAGDVLTPLSECPLYGRGSAYARLVQAIEEGRGITYPSGRTGDLLYRSGHRARPGMVYGPAGSYHQLSDGSYTPILLKNGLKGMIGKGGHSREMQEAIKEYRAVYFAAVGGGSSLDCQKYKEGRGEVAIRTWGQPSGG